MDGVQTPFNTSDKLATKARRKFVSNYVAKQLSEYAEGYHEIQYFDRSIKSTVKCSKPKKESYKAPFFCSTTLQQTGQKITARYCNHRCCMVCNGIRTAKLINGYVPVIQEWENRTFVTLTVPNVQLESLKSTVEQMNSRIRDIKKDMSKRDKIKFKGLRKLEITYNYRRKDYHPHFHLIVDNYPAAERLVDMWLKRWKGSSPKAQDIQTADINGCKELFKYFTKIFAKIGKDLKGNEVYGLHTESLYEINEVMRGRRTFQPMGVKKAVSEDVEDIQSEVFDIVEKETFWHWMEQDWFCEEDGEALTKHVPSEKTLKSLITIK